MAKSRFKAGGARRGRIRIKKLGKGRSTQLRRLAKRKHRKSDG
jgi:hypothetical protein